MDAPDDLCDLYAEQAPTLTRVIGSMTRDREAAEGTVGVRHRALADLGAQPTAHFIAAAVGEARSRAAGPAPRDPAPAGAAAN